MCSWIARFWWARSGKERGIHWMQWYILSNSKKAGGMGFKDFNYMNLTLLGKQAWHLFQHPISLWAQILKAKYFPDCTILEALKKKGSCWVWASILQGRDFLTKHGRWIVGNGESIKIWKDNGIPRDSSVPNQNHDNNQKLGSFIDHTNKT